MGDLAEIILIGFAAYGVVSYFFNFVKFVKLPTERVNEIISPIISSDSESEEFKISDTSSDSEEILPRKRQRFSSKPTVK